MRLLTGPGRPKRFFDRLASRYDRINARLYKREWLDRVRDAIRGERVLDVGVGTGFTTNHLDGAVGIDLSREMLRRARYRGHLVQTDFTRPPFRGPTFDTDRVVAVMAGGRQAFVEAQEGAEDDAEAGARDLEGLAVGADDAVVAISASGRTPYVLGAAAHARARGAVVVGLSCNEDAALSRAVDVPVEVVVGPEFIAGSTRLKAGTAQKLVLNMISTIAMVKLGKTFGNLMVDVRATNEKLRARAVRIVAQAAGAAPADAETALAAAEGDAKTAILMLLRGLGADDAKRRLEACGRDLRRALA